MKQTAVVILNWNGKDLLERFLPALLRYTPSSEADIIVVDNGSTDESVAFLKSHYPEIELQVFPKNYGFAEGYNRALVGLHYKYVVILNSDVEVSDAWLTSAVRYLDEHPEVTALQPKILSCRKPLHFEYAGACGGFIDKNAYPFCRGRIFNVIEKDCGQYDKAIPVFWTSGACLFIRLQAYKEVGGFDEQFFAHQEEIDLCWRLNARGHQLVCFPQSVVYHLGAATLKKENPQKTYLNFRNNLLMIYKNLSSKYYRRMMFSRWYCDYLAALHFVLKGQIANALAVVKARRDFRKMKSKYNTIRMHNLKLTQNDIPATVWRKSLIWEFYFRNQKTYSDINQSVK
ncbi:MAG: glycosyltransferase family 2 protein [Candidatus Symbiothrix sp.]|jgi:GT2 family glycosyltransferase|nr:glycosyltransferase family 2 protein [Candidatus Symbiothrix sp.]